MVVECADVYSIVFIATCMKTCQFSIAYVVHVFTNDTQNEHLSFSTPDREVGQ